MRKQMTRLCDSSNHDPLSPTRQNQVCGGRSAMEVVRQVAGGASSAFTSPEIEFVREPSRPEMIVVLDAGIGMRQDRYDALRLALQHLFAVLPPDTRLSVVVSPDSSGGSRQLNATLLSDLDMQRVAAIHFPQTLLTANQPMDLNWCFQQVRQQVRARNHVICHVL